MGELRSGDLDRRVTLRLMGAGSRSGELGEVSKTATEIAVWAAKQDVSDRERVASMAVGAEVTTRWRIRYDTSWAGIAAEDELTYGGKTYRITGVKEIARREGFELTSVAKIDT